MSPGQRTCGRLGWRLGAQQAWCRGAESCLGHQAEGHRGWLWQGSRWPSEGLGRLGVTKDAKTPWAAFLQGSVPGQGGEVPRRDLRRHLGAFVGQRCGWWQGRWLTVGFSSARTGLLTQGLRAEPGLVSLAEWARALAPEGGHPSVGVGLRPAPGSRCSESAMGSR